jgi:hypothetical protein
MEDRTTKVFKKYKGLYRVLIASSYDSLEEDPTVTFSKHSFESFM